MSETDLRVISRLISEETKWVVFSNNIAIILLAVAIIAIIIAIILIAKANSLSRKLDMNVETVSNNIMDNNKLVKESTGHYEAIESSSKVLFNTETRMTEALEGMQLLIKEMKIEAGSVRHETVEQTKNIEAAFTKFNNEFENNINSVTKIIAQELKASTTSASEENIKTKQAIIELFNDHMLKIHNCLANSIKITSDLTFAKTTDVIGMTLRDEAIRNVKMFTSGLDEVLAKQQKAIMQFFSMIKEINKDNDVILAFINEEEVKTNKILAMSILENSEKQKAIEEINVILNSHGFNKVAKEAERIEREIISDEKAVALFMETIELSERI